MSGLGPGKDATSGPAPLRAVFLPAWPDNPYQELLAAALHHEGVAVRSLPRAFFFLPAVLEAGRPDIVHVHAPDHFVVYRRTRLRSLVSLAGYSAQLLILRLLGVRAVWTVHDAVNHEGRYPALDRLSRQVTAALSDGIMVHCEGARALVRSACGSRAAARAAVIPHGHYRAHFGAQATDRRTSRASLALPEDARIVLFLGNLRSHKGLAPLVAAWRRLDRPEARLVVAGAPFSAEIEEELRAAAAGLPTIEIRTGYVPDSDVPLYMAAADVVVCPFTSSLTSGSVALAMSFGRPCVAPRLGCVPDMLGEDNPLLYDAGDPDGLLSRLRCAIDAPALADDAGRRNAARALARGWDVAAAATRRVYDGARDGGARARS